MYKTLPYLVILMYISILLLFICLSMHFMWIYEYMYVQMAAEAKKNTR